MARKKIKPAYQDPKNSIDLFDADRLNDDKNGLYCVARSILLVEVPDCWQDYLYELTE